MTDWRHEADLAIA